MTIKVDVLQDQKGIKLFFFEASRPEDKDKLDEILEALVGPFPRRGGFVVGAPTDVLKIEVNTGN